MCVRVLFDMSKLYLKQAGATSAAFMGRQQVAPLPSAVAPADKVALIRDKDAFGPSNTSDWDSMYEAPRKPTITQVPEWLYSTQGFWYLSMAASLWWANLVGAILHTMFMIIGIAVSMRDGSLGTPTVSVYLTNLTWVSNSSDPFLPMYEKTTPMALPVLVMLFFLLSAVAHTTICVLNYEQAFATGFTEVRRESLRMEMSKVDTWYGFYYVWMHQCRNPLRCVLSL